MNLISKAFLLSVVLSGVLTVTIPSTYKLTCRDEKGSAVDWFTVYKLPRLSDNTVSPWIQDGSGYAYMTEKNQTWSLSKMSITNSTSMPGITLDSFYKATFNNSTKLGYILYNDQFGNKSLASRAHAKGIIY